MFFRKTKSLKMKDIKTQIIISLVLLLLGTITVTFSTIINLEEIAMEHKLKSEEKNTQILSVNECLKTFEQDSIVFFDTLLIRDINHYVGVGHKTRVDTLIKKFSFYKKIKEYPLKSGGK
jgi:hypothetical protein